MGKRKRLVPITGQSKLPFSSKENVIPLEQAVKIGDELDIFSGTDSEYECSDNGDDSEMDDDHDHRSQPRQLRSPTSTKCNYKEASSEEDDEEGDDWDEEDDGMDMDEDGHLRTNETARIRGSKAAVDREEGKLVMANNN